MVRNLSYNIIIGEKSLLVMARLPSHFFLFLFQLHSSSSDEAISSRAVKGVALMEEEMGWISSGEEKKQPEATTEEGTSSRVSIEVEEEEAERIRKAQTKIK